jgi:hypothetical protein
MLYVHLLGLVKKNELIKIQGVNSFKMGSALGKSWVLELSGYAVAQCMTQSSVTNNYHSTTTAITFIPQYPAIITGCDISVVRTDVFTGLSITKLVMNL